MNGATTNNDVVRKLKISAMYCSRELSRGIYVPYIRMSGKWLKEAGFSIGQDFTVECEGDKIVLRPVRETHETKKPGG